ncbi:hypothetical protein HMPREF1869_00562 [Bacteroidales bacterium KA00251]|nr:hypothetical protein HMPREF1869_00562 [Bacteroidales bacterium KA00251]
MSLQRLLLGCAFLFGTLWGLSAATGKRVYQIADIPNVQLQDSTQFVSDPEDYLSYEVRDRINEQLLRLRQNKGVECVVVVVPSIGDAIIEDYALQLFRKWGVGSAKQNSGIVVLTAIEDHLFRIETGYGMEGVLTDADAITIFNHYVKKPFIEGNYSKGLELAVEAIIQTIENGAFEGAERTDSQGLFQKKSDLGKAFIIVSICFGAFFFLIAVTTLYTRKNTKRGPYTLSVKDRSLRNWFFLLLLVCFPFALILILWYFVFYRHHLAQLSRLCPICEHESYEKRPFSRPFYAPDFVALITPSERCEHNLRSATYGGAECTNCGYRQVYKIAEPPSRYKRCPSCQTKAYYLADTKEFSMQGSRYIRKIYKCRYCGYTSQNDIRNSNDDTRDAIAGGILGVLLGSALSSRRGGGGFRGGGFGGGSGGGGGATGRW